MHLHDSKQISKDVNQRSNLNRCLLSDSAEIISVQKISRSKRKLREVTKKLHP